MPLATDHLAWCAIDGTVVFLDLARDRYFRLPEDANRRFLAQHDPGSGPGPAQPAALPLPDAWTPPLRQSHAIHEGPFRIGDIARSIWSQRRVERRLASHGIGHLLISVRETTGRRPLLTEPLPALAARDVRGFEQARILRTAADRCLPRSIALALCLAGSRYAAHVVLGVKLAPFAAHCWVQAGDAVLNDELEEVLRYTPILVV